MEKIRRSLASVCPSRVLLLLYVDNISLACSRSAIKAVDNIKAKLVANYRITFPGPARQSLGIEITSETARESANSYMVSRGQSAFISSSLKRFRMENANGAATPMAVQSLI